MFYVGLLYVCSITDLIFGTGTDSASFASYTGEPRSRFSVPNIATNATCESGLQTLLTANRTATTQAAYAVYKDSVGATGWTNITDLTSANHITYDEDTLDTLLATNVTDVHIINTHPRARSENLDLTMDSHGPSTADMEAVCTYNRTDITYGVVDWDGIWLFNQENGTCPYTTASRALLPVIETYAALASVEASQRESELAKYLSSPLTPGIHKTFFEAVNGTALASLSPEQVLAESAPLQSSANITVEYATDVDTFCNSF